MPLCMREAWGIELGEEKPGKRVVGHETLGCGNKMRAGKSEEGIFPGASRGSTALLTPRFQTFQTLESKRIHFCCFSPPVPGHVTAGERKPVHLLSSWLFTDTRRPDCSCIKEGPQIKSLTL